MITHKHLLFMSVILYFSVAAQLFSASIVYVDRLPESAVVKVDAEPLTLRFLLDPYDAAAGHFHSCQIVAFHSKSIFKKTGEGVPVEETMFFAPGSGMATAGAYEFLILSEWAHHYLYYEKESKRPSRLKYLGTEGSRVLTEVTFPRVYFDGREIDFEALSGESLYMVIFRDQNLNKIMDEGEFSQLELQFKK